jgi:tetratricopeptide (TPR) repeat protein
LEEAAKELHDLPAVFNATSSFVKAWIRIYEAKKQWKEVQYLATTLNNQKPQDLFGINKLAESLFQQGRHADALSKMGEAPSLRGADYPLVRYNLARYFCASGLLKEAAEHLKAAFTLDQSLKPKALNDPDLQTLWEAFK